MKALGIVLAFLNSHFCEAVFSLVHFSHNTLTSDPDLRSQLTSLFRYWRDLQK